MSESTRIEKKPTTLRGWLIKGGGITVILTSLGFVGQQGWMAYDAQLKGIEARLESFEYQKIELEKVKLQYGADKEALKKQNDLLNKRLDVLLDSRDKEEKIIWETLTHQNDKIRDSEIKVGVMEKLMEQYRLVRILQTPIASHPKLLSPSKPKTPSNTDTKKNLEKILDEVKKSKKSTSSDDYRNIQQKKWSSKNVNGPSTEQMQQKK